MTDETAALLRRTADLAVAFLESLPDRPVGGERDVEWLRSELVKPLPESGEDPDAVIEELAEVGGRAAVAMAGPRYFGFVIGGALRNAVAVRDGLARHGGDAHQREQLVDDRGGRRPIGPGDPALRPRLGGAGQASASRDGRNRK